MRIISLELIGYKFLALSNINYIKITPESKLHLILGTNGSGKSSLLTQLSPLPALAIDFHKDGSKIIEIEHQYAQYTLKSIFGTSNKYNFIKDSIELNPGGTITTFKELVKQHFNITTDIHELMVGSHHFHAMSTLERRNWFTKISNMDYTYALQYYQKLKEQLRDTQGAIKLNHSRLVQESEKLLTPVLEQQYRTEIQELTTLINSLLELKRPIYNSNPLAELSKHDQTLLTISRQIKLHRCKFLNREGYRSISDIDQHYIQQQSRLLSLSNKITELCTEIENKQKTLEILEKANLDNINNNGETIDYIEQQISNLQSQIRLPIVFVDPKGSLNALMTVYEQLTELFISVASNPNKTISREHYITLIDSNKEKTSKLTQMDAQLSEYISRKQQLEHLKSHSQIKCPQCHHTWYKGYDQDTYDHVSKDIEVLITHIEVAKASLHANTTEIEDVRTYLTLQRQYIDITNNWSILKPLWDYIITTDKFYDNPRQLNQVLDMVKKDMQLQIQVSELADRRTSQLELQVLMSKNQEMTMECTKDEIERLNTELSTANIGITSINRVITKLKTYKDSVIHIAKLENDLQSVLDSRTASIEDALLYHKQEALNETIKVIRLELSQKEHVISKIDVQKALVATLASQITELTDKLFVLKIAVKELSPTEGLIARGLTGFINHFLKQVNGFITKIWTYPLELIPIEIPEDDSVDLDYKFMVRVNDKHVTSDISKCSSAQKEIIDMAFKVISMQYLGLQEFPLFMDEPGSTCDYAHREAIFKAIHQLITASNLSNCFLVSHYEQGYGCMANTDITVLCKNNIVLPRDVVVNKNTIIK